MIVSENLHVFGMGEGSVAERIDDLMQGANPTAATYAKENEMFVRVTARAANEEQARQMMEPLAQKIRERIGSYVYATDCESLEELVVRELEKAGKTLATAESCTGGLLAKRITDVSGASQVFEMGAVTYANRIKEKVLGVSHETLEAHGAVSEETAREMARGIRRAADSDLGVGITGIAGPGGGTPGKACGAGVHRPVRRRTYLGAPHGPRKRRPAPAPGAGSATPPLPTPWTWCDGICRDWAAWKAEPFRFRFSVHYWPINGPIIRRSFSHG